jgi:glycosyltransferase involved in cell wall biosynthesis
LFGGAEVALLTLLEHLDRTRFVPSLAYHPSPAVSTLESRARELGVELCGVQPLPLGLTGARRLPAFARFLRSRRPDIFHAHLSSPLAAKFGLAAAVAARVPTVVATVQLFPHASFDRSSRLQVRLLATGVDRYLSVSGHVARELERVFRIPRKKVVVIPNGVDLSRFPAVADPALRASLAGERRLVLTVARLHEQKAVEVVVRSAHELPDVTFAVAGDGPERESLERLARDLDVEDRVLLLGARDDVPALLAAADLVLLPSRYEGFPLSLLEAMASGKAVVASEIPGVTELVMSGQNGVLVAPGDVDGFARAISELLGDSDRRGRLAAAGRELVEQRYDVRRVVDRIMAEYDSV